MIPLFTPAQVRAMDERTIAAGTPSLVLMDRAAGHLARAVLAAGSRRYGLPVAFVCGKGNNAGDGIAAALRLRARGVDARVHLVGGADDLSADAAVQLRRYRARGGRELPALDLDGAEVVVDCLLGTGATGAPRGPIAAAVERINDAHDAGATVIACDLPTGVDADTGQVPGGAVDADVTLSLGAGKRGLWVWPARRHCGRLVVADIGIADGDGPAAVVLDHGDVRASLSAPRPDGDKRDRGVVVLLAGSAGMAGAAIMSARGALSMGVGLLTLATSVQVRDAVAPTVPEAMTLGLPDDDPETAFSMLVERLEGADALGIGPGLGHGDAAVALVRRLVREVDVPIVLDADGLNAFRDDGDALADRAGSDLVCTPHAREFARLVGRKVDEVWPERVRTAPEVARRWRATLVLKGPATIIGEPSGTTFINPTGSSALSTGGTGDVLTGMLSAALPRSRRRDAVAATVFVHGLAGEIAARRRTPRSVAALDVAAAVPQALREVAAA